MKANVMAAEALMILGVCLSVNGCGGSGASSPPPLPSHSRSGISVSISPTSVNNLPAGGTQAFTATVSGTSNQAVTWSVQESAACGSITTSGAYLAPNSPGLVCHVMATSQADNTKSDTAKVAISLISMYVLPIQVSLGVGQVQTFSATVGGTANTAVTWSLQEGAAGGIITAQGVYTAPQVLGTFHVVATSQADPRFTAAAKVDVVPIAVTVFPPTDTLGPLGVRPFAASVTVTNQAVTWSIQEGPSGGLITSGGVYTARQTQGMFHVMATSQVDSSASAIAVVSVVPSGFTLAGPMQQQRDSHTATLLGNGKALIAGGIDSNGDSVGSAELYDPTAGAFTPTGGMQAPRTNHSATLLPNGKVLVAGGGDQTCDPTNGCTSLNANTAEVYDPASGTFFPTGSMQAARAFHSATQLPNGKVLIIGGTDNSGATLASAELYDPATGTFELTGSMQKARIGHSAILLANGKVLVAGGYVPACSSCVVLPDNTAELYDPATGVFTLTASMLSVRAKHTATLLTSGQVLVTGGDPTGLNGAGAGCTGCIFETAQAELYDPAAGSFSLTGSMTIARASHTATMLPNGKVLIAGGVGGNALTGNEAISFTAELYDPATKTFAATGSMTYARTVHSATLLANGTLLVAGGLDPSDFALTSAELYK